MNFSHFSTTQTILFVVRKETEFLLVTISITFHTTDSLLAEKYSHLLIVYTN